MGGDMPPHGRMGTEAPINSLSSLAFGCATITEHSF